MSEEVIRSIAGGASVRNCNNLFAVRNGVLRDVYVTGAGNAVANRATTEYKAVFRLISRWKKTINSDRVG